ncbi:hypothetical protein IJG76_02630 [Candidatus Saccharibacteria bacterium]|nr:hypothetical protein [Candidatus Saccharibacteria bacterium]
MKTKLGKTRLIVSLSAIAVALLAALLYATSVVKNTTAKTDDDIIAGNESAVTVSEDISAPDAEKSVSPITCSKDEAESTCADTSEKPATLSTAGRLEKPVTLYLFHGEGCPHCAEERAWLSSLDLENLEIVYYEVWYDKENQSLLSDVETKFAIKKSGVPLNVIGDTVIVGYGSSSHTDEKILSAIYYYQTHDYTDRVKEALAGNLDVVANNESATEGSESSGHKLDIFGQTVNLESVSLGVAAILIGLVDGFNPCAMWILVFLISIMLGMHNRKRMFALGFTFLFASAMVYMVIMFSWINVVASLSTRRVFQVIIAIVALIGAAINLKNWWESRNKKDACKVVDKKRRTRIVEWIKKFVHEKSLLLAVVGIIALAVAVNVIELACSAGLPVVFTELLALNGLTGAASLPFILLYIFFFMIDDMIVFAIAMLATKITAFSSKYAKYSHLIGGLIMLAIGILLLVAPNVLTSGSL